MKKIIASILSIAAVMAFAAIASATPSRAIVQELGATIPQGAFAVDVNVMVPIGVTQIQVGALGGELRLAPGVIGYKYGIMPNAAVYAKVNYSGATTGAGVSTSTTGYTIGGAYTANAGGFILNLNPEYVGSGTTTSVGTASTSISTFNINAAALYPLSSNLIAGIEVLYGSVSSNATAAGVTTNGPGVSSMGIALGVRYIVNPSITVDFAELTNSSTSTTPAGGTTTTASGTNLGTQLLSVNIRL